MSDSKYFAKVVGGVVVHVVTVTDLSYIEENPARYGDASVYVETVYNDVAVRGAQVGDSYDSVDGFRPASPYASWLWDSDKLMWVPPVALPEDAKSADNRDGVIYSWDEDALAWVEVPAGS